jgi:pimeloyl-ACP methyl ester carboxylesterase
MGNDAPDWFRTALAVPSRSEAFDSRGTHLHMLTWNWDDVELPAVLLVHGYRAHAHWWDPIAGLLASDFRVAALDISGMGDSGHRASYPPDWPALDVLDAIDHLGIAPATVVAHSYGGSRALMASGLRPERISHAVVLDSYFNFPGDTRPQLPAPAPVREYDSLENAVLRYHFRPRHVSVPDHVLRHVVQHGLRPEGGMWKWKFDPHLGVRDEPDGRAILNKVRARVDYVRAGDGALIDEDRAGRIAEELSAAASVRLHRFAGGHHHFLLQDPQGTAQLLRTLLR